MLILIAECAVYVIASVWPQCLGLGIDSDDLVKALQRNYGAVGQEQFTAAIDLAQANVSLEVNFLSLYTSKVNQAILVTLNSV